MDKEIARKPFFEDLDNILCCPNCWTDITKYEKLDFECEAIDDWYPKYCPECGQKIDWNTK